jgi:tetratricopeptide (TPR) repeat protein
MNIKVFHLFLSLLFVFQPAGEAQCQHFLNNDTDSLKMVIKNSTFRDTTLVNTLNELSVRLLLRDVKLAEGFASEALKLSQALKYRKGEMIAATRLGRIHRGLNNYSRALEYNHTALKIAEETGARDFQFQNLYYIAALHGYVDNREESILNYRRAIRVGQEINRDRETGARQALAVLFMDIGEYDSAVHHLLLARARVTEEKYGASRAMINFSIGELFQKRHLYTDAMLYFNEALSYYEKNNMTVGKRIVLNFKARLYLDQMDYVQAIQTIRPLLGIGNKNGSTIHLNYSNYIAGQAFFKREQYDSASKYLSRAIELAKSTELTERTSDSYCILAEIASRQRKFEAAFEFQKLCKQFSDSMFNQQKDKQLAEMQLKLEREANAKELSEMVKKRTISNIYTVSSCVFAVALVVIFYLVIARQKIREQKNREISEKEKIILQEQKELMALELQNKELAETNLKTELEFRSRELTAYTLNLIHKNEMLESIKAQVDVIKTSSNGTLISNVNTLGKIVNYSIHLDKDWNNFKMHFEQVHQSFFDKLKARYPDLSPNDLKLCALIRLNIDTKQIATLLDIAADSTKVARSRVRKKLGLEIGQNLHAFLQSI